MSPLNLSYTFHFFASLGCISNLPSSLPIFFSAMSNQIFNSSTEFFIEILVFFISKNSILFFFKLVQSFFIVSFPAHVLNVVFTLNSLNFVSWYSANSAGLILLSVVSLSKWTGIFISLFFVYFLLLAHGPWNFLKENSLELGLKEMIGFAFDRYVAASLDVINYWSRTTLNNMHGLRFFYHECGVDSGCKLRETVFGFKYSGPCGTINFPC